MITEISMKLASQNAYKVMSNFGHKSLAALKCMCGKVPPRLLISLSQLCRGVSVITCRCRKKGK